MRASRSHDYAHLIERWRTLSEHSGWKMEAFAEESGLEIWVIESGTNTGPALYLSAGIHGDEPASTEGLLAWAERNAARLGHTAFTIFPCLNPWGLVMNTRTDSFGRDLNRSYNDPKCPQISRQLAWVADRRYDVAVMLHEDYDGTGFYLYEIGPLESWGAELVAAAEPWVGVESRSEIDGIPQAAGVVTRPLGPELFEHLPNHPEALYLALRGTPRCYTLETPSETAIDQRIEAHAAVLDCLWELRQSA